MPDKKPMAYILLIVSVVAIFLWMVRIAKDDSIVLNDFQKEIVSIVHEIQEEAPLIYFESAYKNDYLNNYRSLTEKSFTNMIDELNWMSKHMTKNDSDADKFFHLTLAARYIGRAWEWLEEENFVDTDRHLKAAKERLQKAKEIYQLQEKRKIGLIPESH